MNGDHLLPYCNNFTTETDSVFSLSPHLKASTPESTSAKDNVLISVYKWAFPSSSDAKESACNMGDQGSIPGLGRFPWRRECLPTPVFLPGEFHGQRNLAGYSSWDCSVRCN